MLHMYDHTSIPTANLFIVLQTSRTCVRLQKGRYDLAQ